MRFKWMGLILFLPVLLMVPEAHAASAHLIWVLSLNAFQEVQSQGKSGAAVANSHFNTPTTYLVIEKSADLKKIPVHSIPTLSFSSYQSMKKAFKKGITPGIKAVMLKLERGDSTPKKEQARPGHYYELGMKLARKNHLQFLAVPAVELVNSIEPKFHGYDYLEYNRLSIPQQLAKFSDIYGIQSQGTEADRDSYRDFVSQAAIQAKSVNPQLIMIAGLSTAAPVTMKQLFDAVMSTHDTVKGYRLSLPQDNPRPELVVALLRKLSAAGVH